MKKFALASVLAIATSTLGAVPAAYAQAASGSAQSCSDQNTVKDPAEYNTYQNAAGQASPAAKAAALEDFLTKYPNTVVKNTVLTTLLLTYQQANDAPNMLKTAKRVLDSDPTSLRAALVYVYLTDQQAKAKAASDATAAQPMFDDAAKVADAALKVAAPAPCSGISPEDFAKLKTATTPIFLSAVATDDVGKKDYKDAIDNYQAELKSYPDLTAPAGAPGINETYMLGQAYVQEDPKDLPDGIFYLERAAQYAPATAKDSVEQAAEYWYKKYHGGMDGFDPVKQLAHDNATPPASYKPTPAPPPPSPDTLAHQALYPPSGPPTDIKTMALSDKEFVLANGNDADAATVWATMKGVVTEVPGIVVQATASSVQLAVSPDNQQATPKVADFTVNLAKPLTDIPAIGSSVKYDATFDSYTKTPPMIIMSDGSVPAPAKKAPARKPAAHH
jgi:tetratricopeptide (TPR) repeat protein